MTAQELKNSILQYAVQGKLVPQNPNDEPAELLLQKIKAEKQQLIKKKKIKADKPLAPISDEEIPFEIPESWKWVRLGDAFSIVMGQSPDGKCVSDSLNGIEFHQGKVFFSDKYILKSNQTTCEPSKIAEANSVLLCVRAPVGIVNITNREICIGRGLCSIKPLANVTVEFIFYLLATYKNIFNKQATGTTFVAITGEVVRNQLIPLPPLSEQHRIVQKIEELMPLVEAYDKAEKELTELNTKFPEQIKKSVLQYAIQGKLVPQNPHDEPASALLQKIKAEKAKLINEKKIKTEKPLAPITEEEIPFEIPESWEWVRFESINQLITCGYASTPKYVETGRPFLSAKNVKPFRFLPEIHNYISEELYHSLVKTTKPSKGDILLTRVGAGIGEAAIIDIDFDFAIYVSLTLIKPFQNYVFNKYHY